MLANIEQADELEHRLREDREMHDGEWPIDRAAAWYGYLAAARQLGRISPERFQRLAKSLPQASLSLPLSPNLGAPTGGTGIDESRLASSVRTAIQADIELHKGNLPDIHAVVWHAYIDGLADYDGLSWPSYWALRNLIPAVRNMDALVGVVVDRLDLDDLQPYIEQDREAHDGDLPELSRIAWRGYLTGLHEQRAITPSVYQTLVDGLGPVVPPDPVQVIMDDGVRVPRGSRDVARHILIGRTRSLIAAANGEPSERLVIAWKAYLLALLRWTLIDAKLYQELAAMLPPYQVPQAIVDEALVRE